MSNKTNLWPGVLVIGVLWLPATAVAAEPVAQPHGSIGGVAGATTDTDPQVTGNGDASVVEPAATATESAAGDREAHGHAPADELPAPVAPAPVDNATPQSVAALIDAGQFDQAEEMARELLTRNEVRYGTDSPRNIELLGQLGMAQAGNTQLPEATESLQRMIVLLEARDGIFSESLVEPLRNLGMALQSQERLDEAFDAMVRARHITHRRFGVINDEQIPIVDMLTELHIARGDLNEANREQRLAFRIAESNCGDDPICRVDGMYKLARWYQRVHRFTLSRGYYRDALKLLESAYGENHPSLVGALHGVAQTYEQQGYRQADGRRALERAAAILDSQDYTDLLEHAQAHLKLGDWYNLNNDYDKARDAYERAWQVMAANGVDNATTHVAFGEPVKLRYRPPVPASGDPAWHESKLEDAYVTVEFDVNERGRVEDAEVVDANIGARVRKEVRDAVRSAKYRPQMIGGHPVRTEGVRIYQRFSYVSYYQAQREREEMSRRAVRRECIGGGCRAAPRRADISVLEGGDDGTLDDPAQLVFPDEDDVGFDRNDDWPDDGSRPGSDGPGGREELP